VELHVQTRLQSLALLAIALCKARAAQHGGGALLGSELLWAPAGKGEEHGHAFVRPNADAVALLLKSRLHAAIAAIVRGGGVLTEWLVSNRHRWGGPSARESAGNAELRVKAARERLLEATDGRSVAVRPPPQRCPRCCCDCCGGARGRSSHRRTRTAPCPSLADAAG